MFVAMGEATRCIPIQFAKGTRSKGGGPAFVNTKP